MMGTVTDVSNKMLAPALSGFDDLDDEILLDAYTVSSYINNYWMAAYDRVVKPPLLDAYAQYEAMGIFINDLIWKETTGRTIKEVGLQLDMALGKYGTFYNYITDWLGFEWNTIENKYMEIPFGWKAKIGTRLSAVESDLSFLDDDTITKLTYVYDHYDDIKALVEDDIEYVVERVMGEVEDEITSQVNTKIAPLEDRLTTVEGIVASHEYFFFDWLMDMLASILAPGIAMEGDLEAAIEVIKDWVTTEVTNQTSEMKAEIAAIESILLLEQQWWIDALQEKLEITGDGNGGLSVEQIQMMINASVIPLSTQIATVQATIRALVIPTETQVKKWIAENPATVRIADYIGDIDVLLGKQVNDHLIDPEDVVSTVSSIIIADNTMRLHDLEKGVIPITEFLTDDMRTSLTDIVEAFGTPEALLSYLVNAPEGQEEPMLDLMQLLLTMSFERGL